MLRLTYESLICQMFHVMNDGADEYIRTMLL